MKKYCIIIIGLIVASNCYSQILDTTIFNSEFEKQLFINRFNDPTVDIINWFMAVDYEYACQNFIDKIHKESENLQKVTQSQTIQKKLKTAYTKVKNEYCKNYIDDCFFNELFASGNYNCVTASAIYSIMFNYLNIPYTIILKENQVYVIANQDQNPFIIKPNPNLAIRTYSNEFMSSFIEYLYSRKIIFDTEFKSENTFTLFTKYYISERPINLKQLCGILYLNKGINYYYKSNFEEALKNFEKAVLLYPSNFNFYMQSNAAVNLLSEDQQKKKFNGKTLAKYLISNGASSKALNIAKDYFNYATNELVLNHPNIQQYDKFYSEMKQFVDSVSMIDFTQIYTFNKAYYYYLKYDFPSALTYITTSYKCNPDNLQTRQFLKEVINRLLLNNSNNQYSFENFETILQSFQFLKDDADFQRMYLLFFMQSISGAFNKSKTDLGNKFLDCMDYNFKTKYFNVISEETIVNVYNQITTYFYGRQDYVNALKTLERGLSVLPNSELLKKRYKSILDYKFAGKKPVYKEN